MIRVRRATEKDIPRILELLVQVNMVHHLGRPDLFNGPATKYTEEELLSFGINKSMSHVDFMIGSEDLNIVGTDVNGQKIQIFKDGNWAF